MTRVTPTKSLHRKLVDEKLGERGTTLRDFVEGGRRQGKSLEEIWMDLRQITEVPFATRTLYRWVEALDEAAS